MSQVIRFPSQCPHSKISNSDHQFFLGSFKSKGRWLFMNSKLSLKIFWFQALWKPRFKNKGNFWIICVCIKTFASRHTHKGAFTSWHTYMNICIMTYLHEHLHHGIPTKGHLHHDIPIRKFLHLHPCKGTLASQLNMCTGTIIDKLCICTPAWNICIIHKKLHFASSSRSISIGNKKSRLA